MDLRYIWAYDAPSQPLRHRGLGGWHGLVSPSPSCCYRLSFIVYPLSFILYRLSFILIGPYLVLLVLLMIEALLAGRGCFLLVEGFFKRVFGLWVAKAIFMAMGGGGLMMRGLGLGVYPASAAYKF